MTNTPITEVSEALKLLNTLVERGKELTKGLEPPPWKVRRDKDKLLGPLVSEWGTVRYVSPPHYWTIAQVGMSQDGEPTAKLIAASRSLVPAMAKGAKTILKKWQWLGIEGDEEYGGILGDRTLEIANDYRPAMVELGWWPK